MGVVRAVHSSILGRGPTGLDVRGRNSMHPRVAHEAHKHTTQLGLTPVSSSPRLHQKKEETECELRRACRRPRGAPHTPVHYPTIICRNRRMNRTAPYPRGLLRPRHTT
jgi:hypothetical protein